MPSYPRHTRRAGRYGGVLLVLQQLLPPVHQQLYCTPGGRCTSGTSVLHRERRARGRRGAGQASWATATTGPAFELSPPSVLCACLVRVHLSGSPASAFLLRHRLVYLCSPPIHEAGPRRGREFSTTSAGSPPAPSSFPAAAWVESREPWPLR